MSSNVQTIQEQVHTLADQLPTDATWDDLLECIETIRDIQAGLAESAARQVIGTAELRAGFELQ